MPDPKQLSEQNRAKLDGIVQQMIANKESDSNINFVVEDFKSKYGVKKKDDSNATVPNQKLDSAPTTGSSGGKNSLGFPEIDTNGIAPDFDKMKPAVENPIGKEKRLRKELSNTKVTPQNMDEVSSKTDELSALQKENQKQRDLQKSNRVKKLEASFYDATKNNDDDIVAEQRLNDAVNVNGIWNNIKDVSKKAYNKTISGLARLTDEEGIKDLKTDIDPLADEKKQIRLEAIAKKENLTPTEIDVRAKELFKSKEKDNLFVDRANSFLDNLDDDDKKLLEQDRYDKGVHLQEDNLKRAKLMTAMEIVGKEKIKQYKDIESQLISYKDKGKEFPEELYSQYLNLSTEIEGIANGIKKNSDYIQKNKKDLGTVEQEFDLFKRENGDWANLFGNLGASTMEAGLGLLSGLDYIATLGGNIGDEKKNKEVQDDFSTKIGWVKAQRENLRKPVESIESGEGLFNYASDLIANQIPNLLITSTGAKGLAAVGTISAGQKFTEMNKEIAEGKASYSPLQMAVAPLLYGSAEIVSEIPTLSILKKGGRVLESIGKNEADLITKTAKQKAKEWAKDYSVDMSKEMTGEQFTNFAQNFNDKYVLGKKNVGLLDNTGRVFKDTFTLTSILKVAPHTFGAIAKPFQSKADLGKLDENSQRIIEFSKQLNAEGLSDTEKQVIQKQIDKATAESSKIVANTIGKIENMPGVLYDEVVNLNQEAGKIKAQAKEINDGNLPNKKELLKSLSEDYSALQEKRTNIIEGRTTAIEVLPLKERETLKRQAMEDLVTELNPDGKKNITITNEQVVAKANEIYKESFKNEAESNNSQINQPSNDGASTTVTDEIPNPNQIKDAQKQEIPATQEVESPQPQAEEQAKVGEVEGTNKQIENPLLDQKGGNKQENDVSEPLNNHSEKTDQELEDRWVFLEDKLGSNNENHIENKKEFNSIEKELEKREWKSVMNVSPEESISVLKNLKSKENSFIEKRDVRESLAVVEKYKAPEKLSDEDLKNDFKDALFGNPTTWYADGLRLKYAVQESINRGISDKELIKYAEEEFINEGNDIETAKKTVAGMLKPIFENFKNEATPSQDTPTNGNVRPGDSVVGENGKSKSGESEVLPKSVDGGESKGDVERKFVAKEIKPISLQEEVKPEVNFDDIADFLNKNYINNPDEKQKSNSEPNSKANKGANEKGDGENPSTPEKPKREAEPKVKKISLKGRTPLDKRRFKGDRKTASNIAPSDVTGLVMRYFIDGGKISKEAILGLYKGSLNEFLARTKIGGYAFTNVLDKRGNIQSLDDLAHEIWENQGGLKFDTSDIKNAIEDVVGSHTRINDMVDAYLQNNGQEAENNPEDVQLEYEAKYEFQQDFEVNVEEMQEVESVFDNLTDEEVIRLAENEKMSYADFVADLEKRAVTYDLGPFSETGYIQNDGWILSNVDGELAHPESASNVQFVNKPKLQDKPKLTESERKVRSYRGLFFQDPVSKYIFKVTGYNSGYLTLEDVETGKKAKVKEEGEFLNYVDVTYEAERLEKGIQSESSSIQNGTNFDVIQYQDNVFEVKEDKKNAPTYKVEVGKAFDLDSSTITKDGKKLSGKESLPQGLLLAIQQHVEKFNPESKTREINRFLGIELNKPIPKLEEKPKQQPKLQPVKSSPELVEVNKKIEKANENLRIAKEALDRKSKALDKELLKDNEDLFGERKSQQENKLFDERVDDEARNKATETERQKVKDAQAEVTRLNDAKKKIESGETVVTNEIDFEGNKQELKNEKNARKEAINEQVDKLFDKIKKALPKGGDGNENIQGIGQDQLLDFVANAVKALISKGIDIDVAIKEVIDAVKAKFNFEVDANTIKERLNPKEEKAEPKKAEPGPQQKPQAFSTRSFNSENLNEKSKEKLHKLGLNYDVENQEAAQKNAEKIIAEIGIVDAYNLAKEGQIRGGAKTWIMAQMFEEINNQAIKATNENNLDLVDYLTDEAAKIMKSFADEKTLTGQEIAMLNRVYQRFDMKYDLNFAKENWEKRFKEEIPVEVEAKLKKLEKEIEEFKKQQKALEERIGTLEEQEAINNLKHVVKRAGTKKPSESSLKKAAIALRNAKFTKSISDLANLQSDPLGVVKGIFDGAIETIATALDKGSTIEQAIKKGIIEIQKSDWYKKLSHKSKIEADKIAKRDFKQFIKSQIAEDSVDVEENAVRIPYDLLYELVSQGVDNITDLTNAVRETMLEEYPGITHREVRDLITGYGKQISETQDDIQKEISRLKTDGKQMSALDDLNEGNRPKRSGRKPKDYTPEQRNRIKKIRELLKKLPIDDTADVEKFYKSALEGYKTRVQNRINDLNEALDKNQRIVNEKRNTILDQQAEKLVKERDALQKEYDDTFGKPFKSDETLINEIIRRKEKSLRDLEVKLEYAKQEGKELPKKEKREVTDAKIDELNKQIEKAKEELNDVLEEAGIAESKRLARGISYAKRRLSDLNEKLQNGDYTKKSTVKYKYNKELIDLKVKIITAKTKWDIEFEKQEFKKLGYGDKFLHYVYSIFGTIKGLKATADLSAMLRQGVVLGSSNPKEYAKATIDMHKFAFSSKAYKEWMAELESADDFIYMVEDGVAIVDTSGDVLRSEERFVGNLLSKELKIGGVNVNVVGRVTDGSERAYGGFLNSLRVSTYRKLVKQYEKMGITREEHPKKYKNIAKFVNNATGRGVMTSDRRVAKLLNIFFFSPRMISAMGGLVKDMVRSDSTPYLRRQAATSIVTFIGYQYVMKMLIASALGLVGGDDDEEITMDMNPVSTDFNKVVKGDRRYDVSAGYGIAARTVSRFALAKSSKGIDEEETDLRNSYGKTPFGEVINFLGNKKSPGVTQLYNLHLGQHPTKFGETSEDATTMDYVNALLMPISVVDFIENVQNDTPEGQLFFDFMLNTYGISVQNYGKNRSTNETPN